MLGTALKFQRIKIFFHWLLRGLQESVKATEHETREAQVSLINTDRGLEYDTSCVCEPGNQHSAGLCMLQTE